MRIVLASQEYPPETAHGGIGTQTLAKAHGLAALGHTVHVMSHSTDAKTHHYHDGDVQVTRVPGLDDLLDIHTEPVRWLTYSTRVAAAVADLHREAPVDVVDFPEWGGEAYVHLLNRTPWNHVPTVVHLHGPVVMLAHTLGWPDVQSPFFRTAVAMEETCVRLADAVFSSSQCSADWVARQYGVDASRIPVIHTGVDTEHFRPRDVPKAERPTIVFVGKLVHNKGVELLLEAVLQLATDVPDLRLQVIGSGEEAVERALVARAHAAGRPDVLDLAGFVPGTQLPDRLSRAHVFAAPSVYEGGPGFVYLEAMACGLPVVACSGSGAAEVVHPEDNGLLVPPNDLPVLTAALHRLLLDEEGRRAMGRRARNYVEREADRRICLGRLDAFYSAVAASAAVSAG